MVMQAEIATFLLRPYVLNTLGLQFTVFVACLAAQTQSARQLFIRSLPTEQ